MMSRDGSSGLTTTVMPVAGINQRQLSRRSTKSGSPLNGMAEKGSRFRFGCSVENAGGREGNSSLLFDLLKPHERFVPSSL